MSELPVASPVNKQERTWAMVCHLVALALFTGIPFGNIFGPLIVWLIKRDEFPLVAEHGKESLNFQISMTIYAAISFVLVLIFIGFILLPMLLIADLILIIKATIKANNGESYRYPFTIRFIK